MSTQSKQWMRITKFIEELKRNNFPTVSYMLKVLRDADIDEGMPCSCSERTFRRDIDTLRNDYHAPIAFDRKKQGFYLTDPNWQFDVPVFSTPKVKAPVDAKILRLLYDANRTKKVLSLIYTRPNDAGELKIFEPHIITLFNGVWYVRGIERQVKEPRTYAVQRITKAKLTNQNFVINKQLVADTQKNGPFDFPKIEGATLKISPKASYFFAERAEAEDYTLKLQKDGSFLVLLPPLTEDELIRFVLSGGGAVELVKPKTLRKKIITCAGALQTAHH